MAPLLIGKMKEGVLLARWKIILLTLDSKDPLTLPGEKLLVSIKCRIPEHEI